MRDVQLDPMKTNMFVIARGDEPSEVLRVKEGEAFMRSNPEFGPPRMVKVSLTQYEIDQLRGCDEMMTAIQILAGVIARLAQMN